MPRIGEPSRNSFRQMKVLRRRDLLGSITWLTSRKGNLFTRLPSGETLTIFPVEADGEGGITFRWCIADKYGPRFSRDSWSTEEEAVVACLAALREGESD
jgi:hypothetical protein